MSSSAPLKRPGEDDIASEQAPFKKARTTAPTPSASPPNTANLHPSTPPPTLLPGLGMNGVGGVTFPTPPSTAGFQSQMHPGPGSVGSGGLDSEQQTPAVEQEGSTENAPGEEVGMAEAPQAGEAKETTEHRRTDHERQEGTSATAQSLPGANSLYMLPTKPLPPSTVPLSANLLELYDLTALQATVARRDPVTGEKINPLRKHYANKVKALGLEGKDKPMKKPGELFGLVDPGWDDKVADGRTLWQAGREEAPLESTADEEIAFGKLNSAFSGFKVGHLPKHEHNEWRDLLGLDEGSATAANGAVKQSALPAMAGTKAPSGTAAFLAKTAPGSAARNSAPASPSRFAARPERSGKKRRYDESSYEGYDEDGYSTGGVDDTGGRRGSTSKRQKRKDFTANSPSYTNNSAAASSSASMVGVRSS